MINEYVRLESHQIVVTGLSRSGKSTFISKVYQRSARVFRDAYWYTTKYIDPGVYDYYMLFDRCNYIDRYVHKYKTQETLNLCAKAYIENFRKDSYIYLFLDDRWRKDKLKKREKYTLITRYLEIVRRIYELSRGTGGNINVIIGTPVNIKSTEFCTVDEKFWVSPIREAMMNIPATYPTKEVMYMDEFRWDSLITAANNYYNGRPTNMSDYQFDYWLDIARRDYGEDFNILDYVKFDKDGEVRPHAVIFPSPEEKSLDRFDATEYTFENWILVPEFQGLNLIAYYQEGKLSNILTEGDRFSGTVVTEEYRNKVPSEMPSYVRAILLKVTPVTIIPYDCVTESIIVSGYDSRMTILDPEYLRLDQASLQEIQETSYLDIEGIKLPVQGVLAYKKSDPRKVICYRFDSPDRVKTTVTKVKTELEETGFAKVVLEVEPIRVGSTWMREIPNPCSWKSVLSRHLGVGSEVEVIQSKKRKILRISKDNTNCREEPRFVCPNCGEELTEFQGELFCNNKDCSFWEKLFTNRYFDLLSEIKGKEWVQEFTVRGRYGSDMVVRAQKETGIILSELIKDPKNMMHIISPPGLSGNTISLIVDKVRLWQEKAEPWSPDEQWRLISELLTPDQSVYSEYVLNYLKYFISKLR